MALIDTPTEVSTGADPAADRAAPASLRSSGPTAFERVIGSGDHKIIGRLWIGAGLSLFVVGLVLAVLVNADIAARASLDAEGLVEAGAAARLTMNTPLLLLFCGALPVLLGLATYVVPLQVGSRTIAFARASALAFWSWLLSTVVFVVTVAANGSFGGTNENLARLGNLSVGAMAVGISVAAVCVAVTVLAYRCDGMTMRRVPMFSWSMVVATGIWVLTFGSLLARIALIHIVHPSATEVAAGYGSISWLFLQPAVYLVALPVLGIVADVVPVMARTRQQLAGTMQFCIGAAGLFAFGAWIQPLVPGTPIASRTLVWFLFALGAAIPLLGIFGGLADTLRRGRLRAAAPLFAAMLSMLVLLLAALDGAIQAIATIGHGDLFTLMDEPPLVGMSVGQFNLVVGAVVLGVVAAITYWGPKIWGGVIPERSGQAAALAGIAGAALFGVTHLVLGIVNPAGGGYRAFAALAAAGAALLAVALLAMVGGVATSSRYRDSGPRDPWDGFTLEWSVTSVPPEMNFESDPTVDSSTPLLDARTGTAAATEKSEN